MKTGDFKKEYISVVEGFFDDINKKGTINKPISRKQNSIIERCVDDNGDYSVTHYEVLKENKIDNTPISIVKCVLETGRTHQIRVHMSYINHPLLGDDLYGGNTNLIKRQALHSYKMSFIHPVFKQNLSFIASIPKDLNVFM